MKKNLKIRPYFQGSCLSCKYHPLSLTHEKQQKKAGPSESVWWFCGRISLVHFGPWHGKCIRETVTDFRRGDPFSFSLSFVLWNLWGWCIFIIKGSAADNQTPCTCWECKPSFDRLGRGVECHCCLEVGWMDGPRFVRSLANMVVSME